MTIRNLTKKNMGHFTFIQSDQRSALKEFSYRIQVDPVSFQLVKPDSRIIQILQEPRYF